MIKKSKQRENNNSSNYPEKKMAPILKLFLKLIVNSYYSLPYKKKQIRFMTVSQKRLDAISYHILLKIWKLPGDMIRSALDESMIKFIEVSGSNEFISRKASLAWIVRTASNLLKDDLKKRGNNNITLSQKELDTLPATGSHQDISFRDEEDKICWHLLYEQVLKLLSPRQVKIMNLALVGFTNFEIAQKLAISERTVKYDKKKALKIIVKELAPLE